MEYARLARIFVQEWDTATAHPCYGVSGKNKKLITRGPEKAWWPLAVAARPFPNRDTYMIFRCSEKLELALISAQTRDLLYEELQLKARHRSFDSYYKQLDGDAVAFTMTSPT